MRSSIGIPLVMAFTTAALASACAAAAEEVTYAVKPGQTLRSIAREQLGSESRWPEIARLNDLRPPYKITAGQILALPPANVNALDNAASSSSAAGRDHLPTAFKTLGLIAISLLVLGGVIGLVGFIWFTLVAFGQGFWWGLGTLLFHPIQYVFLARFWDKAKRSFITQYIGLGMLGIGAAAGFLSGLSLFSG